MAKEKEVKSKNSSLIGVGVLLASINIFKKLKKK